MKRLLPALFLPLFLIGPDLLGKSPAEVPAAPFVAPVPSRCAWTVTAQNAPLPAPSPDAAPQQDDRIVEVRTISLDGLRQDVVTYANDRSEERWFLGDVVFWMPPRMEVGAYPAPPPDPKSQYPSVGKGFPGVQWVGLANYDSVVQLEGTACYHYVTPDCEAWIDAETGLPVAYRTASTLYKFTFAPPPPGPLIPPPPYQKAIDQYRKLASHITPVP